MVLMKDISNTLKGSVSEAIERQEISKLTMLVTRSKQCMDVDWDLLLIIKAKRKPTSKRYAAKASYANVSHQF